MNFRSMFSWIFGNGRNVMSEQMKLQTTGKRINEETIEIPVEEEEEDEIIVEESSEESGE